MSTDRTWPCDHVNLGSTGQWFLDGPLYGKVSNKMICCPFCGSRRPEASTSMAQELDWVNGDAILALKYVRNNIPDLEPKFDTDSPLQVMHNFIDREIDKCK